MKKTERTKEREEDEEKEESTDPKGEKRKIPLIHVKSEKTSLLIFAAAIIIVLILLAYYIQIKGIPPDQINQTNQTNVSLSEIEMFKQTLRETENFSIVMDISGAGSEETQVVFTCGAGLAQSWGISGKNISKLASYVLLDEDCVYATPEEDSINATTTECKAIYEKTPYAYIRYGSPMTVFTNNSMLISVDRDFIEKQPCAFMFVE